MFTHIISYRSIFYSCECIGKIWSDSSKECIKFVAMIDVSDISSPLHSKCLDNSSGHIFLFITVFKTFHVLFASPLIDFFYGKHS